MANEILVDPALMETDWSKQQRAGRDSHGNRPRHDWRLGGPRLAFPAHEDSYMVGEPQDEAIGLALDVMLNALPEELSESVRMRVFEALSFSQIAREQGWFLSSGAPDKKKAWRNVQRGLKRLRERIEELGLRSLAPNQWEE